MGTWGWRPGDTNLGGTEYVIKFLNIVEFHCLPILCCAITIYENWIMIFFP